jgi:riboflavin biosynthesis pyrimidine reductase
MSPHTLPLSPSGVASSSNHPRQLKQPSKATQRVTCGLRSDGAFGAAEAIGWQDRPVQSLYPTSPTELSDEDLLTLYAYPHERFWVRANFVSSVDGAAQGSDYKSGSLSSSKDQRIFATLRSLCDVIVAGAGTARAEGYQPVRESETDEEVRGRLGLAPVPALAIFSRSLDLDRGLIAGGRAPTIIVTTRTAPPDRLRFCTESGPVIIAGETDIDFGEAFDELAALGYQRVLCEGGPSTMRDLVASGRLDELCLTITPLLVAGSRLRITHGGDLEPPQVLKLRHLLESDSELFARYTRG